MASEYFSASRADWCALCKCFIQPHGNAKRAHERSEKHKKNVERKLKDIRHKEANEKKEADNLKKQMADIEAKAAEAYAADLVASGRIAEAAAVLPKPLTAGARLREQEANAKRELETAIERELHAKEEVEYRATQALGSWKFDERSKYYWHAKSSCYFDPKSKMYFNHGTKVWSKSAPDGAPPPPTVSSQPESSQQYALGPYGRGSVQPKVTPPATSGPAQLMPTAKQAFAAAKALNQNSGPSAKASVASASVASSTPKTTTTSMFNLGFGANHPKFEAAKAKTHTAAARAIEATGGRKFAAKLIGGYATGGSGSDANRKRPASAMTKKVDKEEAEALKRREAARARVEARTKKSFGLG